MEGLLKDTGPKLLTCGLTMGIERLRKPLTDVDVDGWRVIHQGLIGTVVVGSRMDVQEKCRRLSRAEANILRRLHLAQVALTLFRVIGEGRYERRGLKDFGDGMNVEPELGWLLDRH